MYLVNGFNLTVATFDRLLTRITNQEREQLYAYALMPISLLLLAYYVIVPSMRYLYQLFFAPLHRVVDLESEEDRKNRYRKRIGGYPPVYPNGWFKVCDSHELKRGQVIFRAMCGLDLAVYRSSHSDQVFAVDAYCTHLGANLAVGGIVNGDCLTCPFHHWSFNGNGQCVSTGDAPLPMPILDKNGKLKKGMVPVDSSLAVAGYNKCSEVEYCEHRIPKQAHSRGYHVIEKNKMIFLWVDAEGRKPHWELPTIADNLYTHGKCVHHVYCHIQEIPENGPDSVHLNVVHRDLNKTAALVKNIWGATWQKGQNEHDAHIGYFRVQHVSTFKDWFNIPFTSVDVSGCQHGPGIVKFDFNTPIGTFVMVQTVTPVAPLHQHVEHVIYAPWYMPRVVAKWFMVMMTSAFEQDIPIWNRKTYFSNPVLVKTDGPILQFRRWYSQFYSENSPTLRTLSERSLEW
jgi:cholesterol 7-dehydrogenase